MFSYPIAGYVYVPRPTYVITSRGHARIFVNVVHIHSAAAAIVIRAIAPSSSSVEIVHVETFVLIVPSVPLVLILATLRTNEGYRLARSSITSRHLSSPRSPTVSNMVYASRGTTRTRRRASSVCVTVQSSNPNRVSSAHDKNQRFCPPGIHPRQS